MIYIIIEIFLSMYEIIKIYNQHSRVFRSQFSK